MLHTLCLPRSAALRQVGETPRLTAIAELLEEAVQREHGRGTVLEARRAIHLVDAEVGSSRPSGLLWLQEETCCALP